MCNNHRDREDDSANEFQVWCVVGGGGDGFFFFFIRVITHNHLAYSKRTNDNDYAFYFGSFHFPSHQQKFNDKDKDVKEVIWLLLFLHSRLTK